MARRSTSKEDVFAVISLYKAEHNVADIARYTGIHHRTAQRLIKQFKDDNEDELPTPKPRPGRPPLLQLVSDIIPLAFS